MLWLSSSIALVAGLAGLANAQNDGDLSPPSYPSPWMRGGNGWQDSYAKAQQFVSGLTLLEKINLTTGVGWEGEACVGNTGSIPRLNFAGLCLQDSPLGIRFGEFCFFLFFAYLCFFLLISPFGGNGVDVLDLLTYDQRISIPPFHLA